MHTDFGRQLFGAAGFQVKQAMCQEAVRLGRVVFRSTHGSRPLPLRVRMGVAAMGQDSNYQLDILEKRGLKKKSMF
jgi:hypothetical protein